MENIIMMFKYMTFRRFVNFVAIWSSYFLSLVTRKAIVWGYPPIVMIEPTNICNLKCPLCPSGTDSLKRPKGYMRLDTFKKTVDQVADHALMLILWNQGEPFLNKDFIEMCRYAKKKNLYLLVSTNANIMPPAEDIVKTGIDRIIVSLDGATQETYNQYRINGVLSKVVENVKNLVEAKRKNHLKLPLIVWQFIVMRHNEHELDAIKRLAKDLGVDKLDLKTAQIYSKEDVHTFLPLNPKYRRYKIEGDHFELKYGIQNKCRRIWTQPVINWDGEVSVCCFDKDNQFKIGNINHTNLKSLWKNQAYQKMRKIILTNRKSIPICQNCGEGVSLKIKSSKTEV